MREIENEKRTIRIKVEISKYLKNKTKAFILIDIACRLWVFTYHQNAHSEFLGVFSRDKIGKYWRQPPPFYALWEFFLAAPPEKHCRRAVLKKREMESHVHTSCKSKRHIYYSSLKESLKSVGNYTKSKSLPSKPLLTAFSVTVGLDENSWFALISSFRLHPQDLYQKAKTKF